MDHTLVQPGALAKGKALLTLVRPKQWIKNAFVLAPLMFTGLFLDGVAVGKAFAAFLLFCIASSATYVLNDIQDVDRDRKHPKKSKVRPLATGAVSLREAKVLLAVLYAVLGAGGFLAPDVLVVIAIYSLLNVAYSFSLKHQPVLDIFTIAIGFVLRVYAGAVAIDVPVSGWMFVTTLCLALYLAAVKRRQELSQSGADARRVLAKYTPSLVDRYAEMSATGALLFYSMFVMDARPQMIVTVPLVLFGLFRYWYIVELYEDGESPTDALTSDWQLMAAVIIWVFACAWSVWPI